MAAEEMAAASAAAIVARQDADAREAGEQRPAHWLASKPGDKPYKPKHAASAAAVNTGTESPW